MSVPIQKALEDAYGPGGPIFPDISDLTSPVIGKMSKNYNNKKPGYMGEPFGPVGDHPYDKLHWPETPFQPLNLEALKELDPCVQVDYSIPTQEYIIVMNALSEIRVTRELAEDQAITAEDIAAMMMERILLDLKLEILPMLAYKINNVLKKHKK